MPAPLPAALSALAALATPAPLQPSLTSAENNIAYAVGAVCAPFVLDGASSQEVLAPRRLVLDDGWKSSVFDRLASRPVRVGFAGFVHVGVGESGVRVCEVSAKDADPQHLRAAVLGVMHARPEGFTPTRSRYLPGRFASEDRLCAAATSGRPNAFLLMSAARPEEKGRLAVLITLSDAATRGAACDRDDVQANYRTLIPAGQPDPSPPPPG